MRVLGAIVLAVIAGGCTSVKMVQRDGCWIRRTENVLGRVHEEIGPCTRAQPKWAEDRFTRLVQECVAQADYRWQVRAIESWSRTRPYPAAQQSQDDVLRSCMQESRVQLAGENEGLKSKIAELVADRDVLRTGAEQERARFQETLDRSLGRLQDSHDRLAGYLGKAAQKPAGTATATASATSDGKATNESGATLSNGSSSDSGASGLQPAPPTTTAVHPAAARPTLADAQRPAHLRSARVNRPAPLRRATEPGCDAPAEPAHTAAPADPGGP